MKVATFIFINFLVSAFADIVLNDLANHYNIFSSLASYFREKTILGAAFYAGLTVAISTILLVLLSKLVFGFYLPKTNTNSNNSKIQIQILAFIILAYSLGYVIDKFIEKADLFGPSLKPFYKNYGSGHSGAIAFIISLFISFLLQKYLIPLL